MKKIAVIPGDGVGPEVVRESRKVLDHIASVDPAIEFGFDTVGCASTGNLANSVAAHAAQTDYLDLDDPGVVADIDDPAAYRELTGASL